MQVATETSSPPGGHETDAGASPPSLVSPVTVPRRSSARVRPPDWRERRRQSEQRSRQKRKDTIESLPEHVAALERAALVLRIMPDVDAIWDEFLDEETKRMRSSLRKLLPAIQEVRYLTNTKAQLQRLLREHQLARQAIANAVARQQRKANQVDEEMDPWSRSVHRWRELARLHYRPFDMKNCAALMNAAVAEKHRFATSKDKLSSGLSFMGWQDSRRIIESESALQFNFDKTYRGHDLNDFMKMAWRLYTEQSLYLSNVMGGHGRVAVNVLQKLLPTAWVVHIAECHDGMAVNLHQLFLIFRVEMDDGAIQYLVALEDNRLKDAISSPSDTWTGLSCWSEWKVLDRSKDSSDSDFTFSLGGSLPGDDPVALGRYMCKLLAALVRAEGVVNYRPTLVFS